jgi:hypothetical protein
VFYYLQRSTAIIEFGGVEMFCISEIGSCLKLNESVVRKLFVDAGVEIDELKVDSTERVSREDLIALWTDRADKREGRLLAGLLKVD